MARHPAYGHRIVADPLQGHRKPQDRRNEPQVAPAGEVARHEQMAQMVKVPDILIDRPVLDQRLVGQARVGIEDRPDTVPEIVLDLLRNSPEAGPDLEQVRFQPLFVETQAHSVSV